MNEQMTYREAWLKGYDCFRADRDSEEMPAGFARKCRSCVYRKLDSAILVMKSAEDGRRCDAADVLDRAMDRSVLVQENDESATHYSRRHTSQNPA